MSNPAPPPPPPGFTIDQPVTVKKKPPPPPAGFQLDPTGEVVDGDTLRLEGSPNGRLLGVDAFETKQQGRTGSGALVPIGQQSATAFDNLVTPQSTVAATGNSTYGRPVVTIGNAGADVGRSMLEQGQGLAVPKYLQGDPRLPIYTETERLARLNRRGAHSLAYDDPADYRRDRGLPPAIMPDSFAGLPPAVTRDYRALAAAPELTTDRLLQFGHQNNFNVSPRQAGDFAAGRTNDLPAPMIEGDGGVVEQASRLFANGLTLGGLPYAGAVPDTLGGTPGRENILNSDRSLADIAANNAAQNRATIEGDRNSVTVGMNGAERIDNDARQRDLEYAFEKVHNHTFDQEKQWNAYLNSFAYKQPPSRSEFEATAQAILGHPLSPDPRRNMTYDDFTAQLPTIGTPEKPFETKTGHNVGFGHFGLEGARDTLKEQRRADLNARGMNDAVDAYAQNLINGPSLRWADDIAGWLGDEEGARLFRLDTDIRNEDHPYASIAGELTGGLVLPFKSGSPGKVFAQGAAYGTAYGAGEGEYLTDKIEGAGMGLTIGGATGVAGDKLIQAASPYARRAWGNVRERLPKGMFGQRVQPEPQEVAGLLPSPRRDVAQERLAAAAEGQATGEPIPAPPPGYRMDSAAMSSAPDPTLTIPLPRQRDYIDLTAPRRMDAPITEGQMNAASQRFGPDDVLPIPGNQIDSIEEAAAISAGRYQPLRRVDERSVLDSRRLQTVNGNPTNKRGPLDLVTWARTQGGLVDEAGELSAMGMTNRGRTDDLAGGEARFGPLVSDGGLSLDEAALRAWEAGYFPDMAERPTVAQFLDALDGTYRGTNRAFKADDFAEVDQFYQQREANNAIAKAEAEGAPLVDDMGQSVTMDDLADNTAPLQAHEDWPDGGPDFAGNINLAKLDAPQDIARALAQTERRVGFDAATRGRVTQAETERLASELGMTPDDLLNRRKGQAFNAEEALAARQILAKSGNELVNMARRIKGLQNPGDELLADFRQAWVRHVAIQEQVSGMTAEAGRALQQFRQLADSRNVRGNVLTAMVRDGGGMDNLKDAAEMIVDAADIDPAALNRFTQQAMKPKFSDKLVELWYNSLLSGPQTHAVNIVSNTMTSLAQLPEHAAASAIGAGRRMLSGGPIERVTGTELGRRAYGLLAGTKEGLRQMVRTFATGEPSDLVTKVEARTQNAISGVKGSILRTPTRALAAEDELFKAMARRMELHGLAARQATKEGLKGEALDKRIADLVANPPDDMLEASFEYGRYLTFQNELGDLGQSVSRITQKHPALKLVLPFVRTPTNLLKFSAERSPAAPLLKKWRADFKAGGARRDLAIARWMGGTGIGALIMQLADEGKITGSAPSDKSKAALMRADGWQPYSIKIGDKYYSYQRLDPFASLLGMSADLATRFDGMTERQREEGVTHLIASLTENLASKTWLSGVSDLVQAVNEPDQYADGFLKRMVGSLTVPTGVNQIARLVDPTLRETDGVVDQVQSRIPFASRSLPPRRDAFGRPITGEGGLGPDFLSPMWESTDRNDPMIGALLDSGSRLGKPSRTVGGERLSIGDYNEYQRVAGSLTEQRLRALTGGPGWVLLSPDQQRREVKKTIAGARKDAREQLFGGGDSGGDAPPPPPPGFSIDKPPPGFTLDKPVGPRPAVNGSFKGRNMLGEVRQSIPGVGVTSGYRSPEYQADMRRRGYNPAQNSAHLSGSALDLTPPPGKSMQWLDSEMRRMFPGVRTLNEGDHLHVIFNGYRDAPPLGGAVNAGVVNPASMLPPGFSMDGP